MLAFVGQLLAVPVLFFLATFGSGQGKGKLANDLTGTWVIDELKSSPWIMQFGQMKLEISFTDPELRVIRDFKKDDMLTAVAGVILQAEPREKFVYFTDGRGEKNRSVFDPTVTRSVVKSMTTWDETRLWCARRVGGQDRLLTWELSSDGKVLTETTTTVIGSSTRITVRFSIELRNTDIFHNWLSNRESKRVAEWNVKHWE